MRLLALDTSNEAMSVAVLDNDKLLAQTTINRKRTHSEQLLPAIDDLVAASGPQPEDLDKIIVADGPGSYTGIRIAVTTGKTLAYTLNIALAGVSSLAVLAANKSDDCANYECAPQQCVYRCLPMEQGPADQCGYRSARAIKTTAH